VFLELKIAGLSGLTLAILPWPPSLQTYITTSSMLWERLFRKLKFQLHEKYFFLNRERGPVSDCTKIIKKVEEFETARFSWSGYVIRLGLNYYFSGRKSCQPANMDYIKETLLTEYIIKYVPLEFFLL